MYICIFDLRLTGYQKIYHSTKVASLITPFDAELEKRRDTLALLSNLIRKTLFRYVINDIKY